MDSVLRHPLAPIFAIAFSVFLIILYSPSVALIVSALALAAFGAWALYKRPGHELLSPRTSGKDKSP